MITSKIHRIYKEPPSHERQTTTYFILKQGKPQLSTRNIPLSSLGILFELYSYVIPALPRLLSQSAAWLPSLKTRLNRVFRPLMRRKISSQKSSKYQTRQLPFSNQVTIRDESSSTTILRKPIALHFGKPIRTPQTQRHNKNKDPCKKCNIMNSRMHDMEP